MGQGQNSVVLLSLSPLAFPSVAILGPFEPRLAHFAAPFILGAQLDRAHQAVVGGCPLDVLPAALRPHEVEIPRYQFLGVAH